jgi:hypothetical protein
MNRAAYERDLGLILKMHVNLIRLHCHFSNPEFYDVADELGGACVAGLFGSLVSGRSRFLIESRAFV